MNRFAIEDSFPVEPGRFVFGGRALEGRVERGMFFEVAEPGHRWRLFVQSVEYIRKSGGSELIGLVVQNERYSPALGAGCVVELCEHESGA